MQRQLSIISGSEQSVVMQQAQDLFGDTPQTLWVTQHTVPMPTALAAESIPASKARTVLGREFYRVIFDAWSGLDVNALAAVVGTIRVGGVLVLLTPLLPGWPKYPDPSYKKFLPHPWQPEQMAGYFLQRFVTMLEESALLAVDDISAAPSAFTPSTTEGQLLALEVILQAKSPVVLNADRGRGKSAVLGMAVQALEVAGQQVIVTAPSRATVETVFKHAGQPVNFYAPDDLLQCLPEADVLMVDEAAAIPVPMLIRMLRHYPRCVFSTTLQGYEGSGRGFVLRFQNVLGEEAPDWQSIELLEPIRWCAGDWLEAFMNRCLVMDGEVDRCLSETSVRDVLELPSLIRGGLGRGLSPPKYLQYKQFSQSHLVANEPKLREIFNLLINAHYQTRPSDLRQMLDAPQISIHVLEHQQQVVAVALLSSEGGLEKELVAEIHAGKRRPHGHLLAQSLTFHAGIEGAACLKCERIMRIAVRPEMRGQGVGHYLLGKLREYALRQEVDYLGVSYALSVGLLAFWAKSGFISARLGFRKDTASGSRSLMQTQGLSNAGVALSQQAQQLFQAGLPNLLEKLGDVPEALAGELLGD